MVNLSVVVAVLEGCSFVQLNDPRFLNRLLDESVAAGSFTELHRHVHQFEPQGLTAMVVLSESHISLHSWPEHGVLFVDMASCSGELTSKRAFEKVCSLVEHSNIRREALGYINQRPWQQVG